MRLRTKVVISALTLVAGLGCAELCARLLIRSRSPPTQAGPSLVQPCADPRIRFENRPGARQVLRYLDRRGDVVKEVAAAINDQGFRGSPVEIEKPPGRMRILVIGDSQTFGAGVGEGESWPAVLEESLRKSLPDSSLEVMNCAVPGYDAEQSEAALETRWLDFHPDLVLLGYFANDPTLAGVRVEPPATIGRQLFRMLVPKGHGALDWIRRWSALVDVVLDGIYRRLLVREWARDAVVLHADDFEGWRRTRAAIDRERDLCRASGARFAVILVPFLVKWGDALISTEAYKTVSAHCASEGIPTFDPAPCFAKLDLDEMVVHERDSHGSPKAHRIEGEAIAGWILERELLR